MDRDLRARRLEDAGVPPGEARRRARRAPAADLVRSPGRPPMTCNPHAAAVYDWLEANGVHELLPADPKITVAGGDITFTAFVWRDDQVDRWVLADEQFTGPQFKPVTQLRSVPLMVPVPEAVRVAAQAFADDEDCRFTLVEQVLVDGGEHGDGADG